MRLKKLELYGFKSFAQRTEIVLNEGITAIVGPNGSGKSNIGDAVRWVLGEQSAKLLRGASMQDVIFNGTQTRKPLSYCEVSLVFDNGDRSLPLDYAEIMVTRRVYRTGESEYFLNRSTCRLKDVVDLFRDTGIGKEGYSIIGQGRIDEILSRKGEDRRLVFEEAAGIVKFRARKEEADRRLAHTRENMNRVDDILDELKRRLEPLEEQAKNARVYLELSAELKELDLNLFLVRSDRMEAKLRDLDSDLLSMKAVLDQTESTLQEKGGQRDSLQSEISALEEKISDAHQAVISGMETLHQAQDAARRVEDRRSRRQENKTRTEEEMAAAAQRLKELEQLFSESESGSESRSRLIEEKEKALEEAQQAETLAREEEASREQALEAHQDAVMDAMNRHAAALNDQTRLKTMFSTMETRLEEVTVTCGEMKQEAREKEEAVRTAQALLTGEESLCQEKNRLWQESVSRLNQADADVIQARQEYDRKLAELRDMESRQKLLSEMSREMEGYAHSVRAAIKQARDSRMDGVYGVLSQLIQVPQKFETALDMVLGQTQQNIVTKNEETAQALIEYLRRNHLGRATFLPVTSVKSRTLDAREREVLGMPGCLGVASELVDCDPRFRGVVENLLGRTLIAEDLDHGIAIMRRGRHAFRLVTLQGDVMHSGGSMTGGSVSSRSVNLFSRERELKELTEKLASGQTELEKLLGRMQEGQRVKDALKRESADALESLHQQEIAVARETEHVQNAEADRNSHAMRLSETEAAREQLMESMNQIEEQLSMVTGDTSREQQSREEMEQETSRLQALLAEARKNAEDASAKAMSLTLEVNDLRHEAESLQKDRERFRQERERMDREQARRAEDLARMAAEEESDAAEARKLEAAEAEAQRVQAGRENVIRSLENTRTARQSALREILSDIEGLYQSHGRDAEKMHRLELNRTRTDGDLKALRDRIWNTYEMTYAMAEEYRRTEDFNITEADRRAAQISTEIRALGVVNVKAVEEYAETTARADELTGQREDLEKAEKDLKDLISRLLNQMESTFVENFTLLQGYFSETFRRLFGGGHAELILMDPSDPLNCGIEINAQPPGKKLQLLTLLSGGERTLTAIAILFATLKLKPTPFCILDEIEAALDDANIGYFADYLQEYSRETQFIVVTHRKGTMERANSLYGVAMEEQGVSKMVSVSLQDYQE
ncbi:MAG: chromosome segregation protein SMC [Clostridiales bacterium]|nr:chromosome segregation protein SMC [Clostridiales bacterium]